MELMRKQNVCQLYGDCKKCKSSKDEAKKIAKEYLIPERCAGCLRDAMALGVNKENIMSSRYESKFTLCTIMEGISSRNLGAVFQSNCPGKTQAINLLSSQQKSSENIDSIVQGLRVKYTENLDFKAYLNLIDGKTVRAIRNITDRILFDP